MGVDKQKIIDTAVRNFSMGQSCSQSVLTSLCLLYDLPLDKAYQIASGLGGGMGRTGGTCGAVSGAILMLGLRFGPKNEEEIQLKEKVYEYASSFCEKFENKFSALNCSELLNCDVSTPEGREKARSENLYVNCPEFVRSAVEILLELI